MSTDDDMIVLETACKTKKCPVCRHKVVSKFKMLVEYGCLTLSSLYFITLTLRASSDTMRDADFVRGVWRKALVLWNTKYPQLEWIRVVELTKKGQPHLHLVMTFGVDWQRSHCETKPRYDEQWRDRHCDCGEHTISRDWASVCADGTYVVKVRELKGGARAASYLAKYISKDLLYRERLQGAGFSRSWSRSRGWPGAQLELLQTKEGGWTKVNFTPGVDPLIWRDWRTGEPMLESHKWWIRETSDSPLQQRTGDDLAWELGLRNEKNLMFSEYERMRRKLLCES